MKVFFAYLFSFAALLALSSSSLQAAPLYEYYRGARAQAMGNAFVGLADDEQALFYNPAGLGGNQQFTFHYAVGDVGISTDIVKAYTDGSSGFAGLDADTLDLLMGKNIYGGGTFTSTLMIPSFAIAFVGDAQFGLSSQNKAFPQQTLGYQFTNGIQAAVGFSVLKARKNKNDLRFGIGAKLLARRGGYYLLPGTTMLNMGTTTIGEIVGNYGRGIGLDLGTQYVYKPSKNVRMSFGASYMDIGDTSFGEKAAPITGNLTLGVAGQFTYGLTKLTATYDYRHILDRTDWRKKNHLGLEVGLPLISLYGGVNEVFLTYGAALDLWLFRLTAYSYAIEHGSFIYQNSERRYAARLALKFDL